MQGNNNNYNNNNGNNNPANNYDYFSRLIMHIDFDYFFAQCEEMRHPGISDKPVVVCVFSGRTADSGVVSTANYIARRYGIKSGIPIQVAKSKLSGIPSAIILPIDIKYYKIISESAMSIIQEFVDKYEYIGLDECFADITSQTMGDYLEAEKIAIRIKEKIRNGIGITCSIGVAPNKLLAKIASDIKKPDGLTLVRMENVGEFLKKCNLEQIPGIGPKTIKKLNKIKINSLYDLANADLFLLVKEFGRRTGTYIHNASKGIDNQNIKELKPFQKQLGKIVTLKTDATRSDQMDPEIMYMSRQLCAQAKAQNISFKNIAITLILRDLKMISRSKSMKSYVNDSDNVHIVCRELLDDLFNNSHIELVVRRIGIRLGDLKENIGQNTILDFIKQD